MLDGKDISPKSSLRQSSYLCISARSRIHKYVRAAWCTLWRGLSYTLASGDTGCAYLEGWQAWRMSANAGQGATRLLRTTNDATRRDAMCPRQDEFSVGRGDFTFTDLHESNYGVLLLPWERNIHGGYSAALHAKSPDVLTAEGANGEEC